MHDKERAGAGGFLDVNNTSHHVARRVRSGAAGPQRGPAQERSGPEEARARAPAGVFRTRRFVVFTAAAVLIYGALEATVSHRIARFEQAGFDLSVAARWAAIARLGSLPGRFFLPLRAVAESQWYSGPNFGRIMGVQAASIGVARASWPVLIGATRQHVGEPVAMAAVAAAFAAGAVLVAFSEPRLSGAQPGRQTATVDGPG